MNREKKLSTKLLLMFLSVAIITISLLTGTLAAFSATYTWQTPDAMAGTFDYEDTSIVFDLFGEEAIVPSDFGSKVLSGVDFEDKTVSWGFSETNSASLPVLFYVDDGASNCGFYSAYDFATAFPTYYLKLDATSYVACSDVSVSSADLASELGVNFELCWIWPDKLFSYDETVYTQVSGDIDVDEFVTNNQNFCKTTYSYNYDDSEILTQLRNSQNGFTNLAISSIANGFSIEAIVPANFSISNGKIFCGESFLTLYSAASGDFILPEADYSLASGDYYLLYSNAFTVGKLITNFSPTGLNYQIVGNTSGNSDFTSYYINQFSTEISTVDNGNTAKPILKLFPSSVSVSAPTISVAITAEVSIG